MNQTDAVIGGRSGLVCENAFLIVEYAWEKQREEQDPVSAALEACKLRLRPILMTSIAFIAGGVSLGDFLRSGR